MESVTDKDYMRRCLQLASLGQGFVAPNPMVGAVLVHNQAIIAEGFHQAVGGPHAEVDCLNKLTPEQEHLLPECTLYVSLEPCSHFGKTPPCADLILKYKIPNVVIGTIDPNSKVAGKGIQKLIDSGVNVTMGILEKECNELNKRFFTFHKKNRPYIILKWAESSDGFISPKNKSEQKPVWISNDYSRQLVHKWRSEEQAILVGTQTIMDDNPSLTVREWVGKNPIRVVIDKENSIDSSSNVLDNQAKTIVFSNKEVTSNTDIIQYIKINFDKNSTQVIVEKLYENNIQSIIIEGGRKTIQSFIDANLWDEARVFIGEIKLLEGTKAPAINRAINSKSGLKNDTLIIYRNDD